MQARRWTTLPDGGFIHSFNGAHSLFVDTIRSLRSLALGHLLGQRLMEEQDAQRQPARSAGRSTRAPPRSYNVYFGRGRDRFDVRGRTAHESLFNVANGTYRGPSTQQGYSPFTTWTRGLAWAMLGFAEQLEFLATLPDAALERCGGRADDRRDDARGGARDLRSLHRRSPRADGVPYWDAGAPGLARAGGLARSARRSVQRSRAGRQLRRGDRGAGAAAPRPRPAARGDAERRRATSRPACAFSTRCSTRRDRT